MKYKIFFALLIALFTSTAFAQVEAPQKSDFEKALEVYGKSVKFFDDMESYEGVKVYNSETKQTKPFADLDEYSRDFFILQQGRRLSEQMLKLSVFWAIDKEQLNSLISQDMDTKTDVTIDDMDKYSERILNIRKMLAIRLEEFAKSVIEKHESKFTEQESKDFIDEIKSFHNKYNLIDRSKE